MHGMNHLVPRWAFMSFLSSSDLSPTEQFSSSSLFSCLTSIMLLRLRPTDRPKWSEQGKSFSLILTGSPTMTINCQLVWNEEQKQKLKWEESLTRWLRAMQSRGRSSVSMQVSSTRGQSRVFWGIWHLSNKISNSGFFFSFFLPLIYP